MSKTKGNVIDPIEIVERYGTDAVRFTLASMASPGTDIAFNEARTDGYRAFANKIWNAARFIFMNVDRAAEAGITVDPHSLAAAPAPGAASPVESRWITSRLNSTAAEVNKALGEYRFHEAASLVYQFFWGDFCDWYLEIVKLRLDFSESADKQATTAALTTLLSTFEAALRLLSPFMPFLTEELWHAVYDSKPPAKSIALTCYPQPRNADTWAEASFAEIQTLIGTIRELRKAAGAEEKAIVPVAIHIPSSGASEELQNVFLRNQDLVQRLARVSNVEFKNQTLQGANVRHTPSFDVQVIYERTIDVAAERDRLTKELTRLEGEQERSQKQLSNDSFLGKAPAHIVEGLRKRAAELVVLIEKTRKALDELPPS
jgi:valyl-tRNA synthetase